MKGTTSTSGEPGEPGIQFSSFPYQSQPIMLVFGYFVMFFSHKKFPNASNELLTYAVGCFPYQEWQVNVHGDLLKE